MCSVRWPWLPLGPQGARTMTRISKKAQLLTFTDRIAIAQALFGYDLIKRAAK